MRWKTMTLVAAVVVSCSSATALGQDKGWFEEIKNDHDQPFFNVDFPGGTAAQYYHELGAASVGRINVVVHSGVDMVELPAITIRNANAGDLIDLPAKLYPYLIVDGTKRLDPVSAVGNADAFGAYTVVVTVALDFMRQIEQEINRDPSEMRFDLQFKGGSAVDYVEAIREAYPGANILAMPGLEGFVVPAVNLDGVTVDAALESIEGQEAMVDGAWAKVRLSDADIEGREERVFTISLERHENEEETKIWSVGNTLAQGVAEADLLSAVKAALDLNQQAATVRFHPETKLLMVRGRRDAVKTAEETLQQVQRGAGQQVMTQFHWSNQKTVDDLRARIVELERHLGLRDGD